MGDWHSISSASKFYFVGWRLSVAQSTWKKFRIRALNFDWSLPLQKADRTQTPHKQLEQSDNDDIRPLSRHSQWTEQRAEQRHSMSLLAKQGNKSLDERQLAATWFKRQPIYCLITGSYLMFVWILLTSWPADNPDPALATLDSVLTILLHGPGKSKTTQASFFQNSV